jgi:protease-4
VLVVTFFGVYQIVHKIGTTTTVAEVAPHTLLRLNLEGSIPETSGVDPIAIALSGGKPSLRDLVDALDSGAADAKVSGLIADLGHAQMSLATAQELSAALGRFRKAGKPAYAYADTLAESASNTQVLFLASQFDQVWLQPAGEIGATGLSLELPYVADALKTIGVTPRFSQRYEFKGGIDMYVAPGTSPALKQSLGGLVSDLYGQIVDGIAAGRKLSAEDVRHLIDRAPLSADEALGAKLIDHIGYRVDSENALRHAAGTDTGKFMDAVDYLKLAGPLNNSGERIAVIYGVGEVVRGDPEENFSGSTQMSAEGIARAFREATRDSKVRAIVFRIDSPGGSYVASDTIWHAVHQARQAGKKVIASMGGLAASGGYFSAVACDRIIAEPASLTGSIGVYSGKFVLTKLWDKIGVKWDQVSAGAHAGIDSMNNDFTPDEMAGFERSLDRIYGDFSHRVATDRHIPEAEMDSVARGRVWSGASAKAHGLVDELGDFRAALIEAKRAAGINADAAIELVTFPKAEQSWQRFAKLVSRVTKTEASLQQFDEMVKVLGPTIGKLAPATAERALLSPLHGQPIE